MNQYNAVGDMSVFVLCIALLLSLKATYTQKTRRYIFVLISIMNLMYTSSLSIFFNHYILTDIGKYNVYVVHLIHNALYIGYIFELGLFLFYILDLINYHNKKFVIGINVLTIIYSLLELTSCWTHIGFYIDNGSPHQGSTKIIYMIWYILYIIIMLGIVIDKNKVVINKIYFTIFGVFAVSLSITVSQFFYKTETFTSLTYLIPILVVVILFHCSSYNSSFGAVDRAALNTRLESLIKGKKEFIFVNIMIPKFLTIEHLPQTSEDFKDFTQTMNYKDYLFRYNENSFVMIFNKDAKLDNFSSLFDKLHDKYQMSHHITIIESNIYCKTLDDYMNLCNTNHMNCHVYKITENDLVKFNKMNLIKKALEDIEQKMDLNDERVKVYCQPILDIESKTFTTAESLMRLEIDGVGFIYPDLFIPIAEAEGNIHSLTLIILNKVCQFIEQNQNIKRISVNFSMYEIVKPNFYEDVIDVITKYSFDKSKLGFEITESIDANDFDLIGEILTKFRSMGIKIYLDDFGTGYSNIEHIARLPIDIIKFDRSLVISSGKDSKSKMLVEKLSDMFTIIGCNLLYEGIEDENDQNRCIQMKAEYLQGYKYSKPIPIENLVNFIGKEYLDDIDEVNL